MSKPGSATPAKSPAPAPAARTAGPSTPGAGAPGAGKPGGPRPSASGGGPRTSQQPFGAGATAGRATGRPGQGSVRNAALREARHRVVRGDAVQGDKFVVVTGGRSATVLHAVSDATVQAARHAFHDPPGWPEVRAGALLRRSVVLRGPVGSGRTAAAVRLLQSGGTTSWYAMESVAELAKLTTADDLTPGMGLLISDPYDISDLRGPQLENLEGLLERIEARLVLTAGPETRLDRSLAEYVQRLARPDDLTSVLRAHLAHRTDEDNAVGLLAEEWVVSLTETLLGDSAACRDAARLASILADGIADPEAVRALFVRDDGDDPDVWFDSLGDPVLRTHAVALACLNGLPQEEVALAAEALLRRFESGDRLIGMPTAPGDPTPRARDPFALPLSHHWDRLRARTSSAWVPGDHGRTPCTVAEYQDATMPGRVIRHIWTQYRVQAQLLDWLGELVDSPSVLVRSFAGTTLGLIAADSFDLLAERVFPRWIGHSEFGERRREAVGYALRMCVDDPDLREGVRGLVEGWFQSDDESTEAAAARAYGLCLGGADLASAVDSLTLLARRDRLEVAVAIGDSLADLMAADAEGSAMAVLGALTRMFGDRRSRSTGHLAFLILANALGGDPSSSHSEDRGSWPTLLRLSVDDPSLRQTLARLWSEVIGGGLFDQEVSALLNRWAARAESDAALMDDLLRMLRQLAGQHIRVRQSLLRYADNWADDDRPRPLRRAAGLVRAELDLHRAAPAPVDTRGGSR